MGYSLVWPPIRSSQHQFHCRCLAPLCRCVTPGVAAHLSQSRSVAAPIAAGILKLGDPKSFGYDRTIKGALRWRKKKPRTRRTCAEASPVPVGGTCGGRGLLPATNPLGSDPEPFINPLGRSWKGEEPRHGTGALVRKSAELLLLSRTGVGCGIPHTTSLVAVGLCFGGGYVRSKC